MKQKLRKRFGQATTALVALAVVLSVFGSMGTVAAAPGVSVTQSANSTTVNPGDTVEIQTAVSVNELNAPQLSAVTPDGWSIESQSAAGPAAYNGDGTWQWLAGGAGGANVSYTVTYTVSVPDDAAPGDYTIGAEGSALSPDSSSRSVDSVQTTITVEEVESNDGQPTTEEPTTEEPTTEEPTTEEPTTEEPTTEEPTTEEPATEEPTTEEPTTEEPTTEEPTTEEPTTEEPSEPVDSDGDGLTDEEEAERETDPECADSDGDGLDDGREVELGTDPTDTDTDGDGWSDRSEVNRGCDPLDADSHA